LDFGFRDWDLFRISRESQVLLAQSINGEILEGRNRMKSNPTRAGPSLSGNLHSNLSKGNEAGLGHAKEPEGVRSQGRSATSGVEGAR
jgi:hypothetical protein